MRLGIEGGARVLQPFQEIMLHHSVLLNQQINTAV